MNGEHLDAGGYMTIDHPDAFTDYPPQEERLATWKKHHPNIEPTPCPACRGRGGHQLKLNAYGPGRHFACACGQCVGWGFVDAKAEPRDATCIHKGVEIPERSRMCWHEYRCEKCGREWAVDSSD